MNIKKMGSIIIFFLILLLVGCKNDIAKDMEDKILGSIKDRVIKEPVEQVLEIPSPISGIYAAEEKVNRRPIAIMLDNHPNARWQSGLSQAEVVYEYLVEAPYTRYMAIFLINDPESIGPIRSARPYFISSLLEYDPIYVRVGGSPQAKNDIINLNIDDIDGLVVPSRVLWKDNTIGKKSPHNTYTSMEVLRDYQEERGYSNRGNYTAFKFNENDKNLDGLDANNVIIDYNKDNRTSYIYDSDEKRYSREKDGRIHVDGFDNSLIKVKNIIIQEAETRLIDNSGRLFIDIIGEGRGKYISNGKVEDITWVKKSRTSKTYYYDQDSRQISLNPGVTWIQVVKPDTVIDIQ